VKKISERDLRTGRAIALANGADVIHALACVECGLREEFLFVLGILGWDEQSFLTDHLSFLLVVRRDGR
jgi:hypothetical protein